MNTEWDWWRTGRPVRSRDRLWFLEDRQQSILRVTYDLRTQKLYASFLYLSPETEAAMLRDKEFGP